MEKGTEGSHEDTVMVVDDDEQFRKLVHAVLEKENIHAIEACSGEECMVLCEGCFPAVVLMDIVMPGQDGVATLKEIKKKHTRTKVIAISGGHVFTPEIYLDEAKNNGADLVLSKPFERKVLISAVKHLLKQYQGACLGEGILECNEFEGYITNELIPPSRI